MQAYMSKKISWLRFLLSFLSAAGMAAFLCVLLEGPKLGLLYDFLIRLRPSPPVSREILIIDIPGQESGDDILEPGAVTTLLYIMSEFGAGSLVIQVPVLGLSAGGTAGEAEILYRFDEEFAILSNNIRNLFDAIRTGSVHPRDSERYVGELVELSERGKERLVTALVRRDTEGIEKMEIASAFFGDVRRPCDLGVQLITAGAGLILPPIDSGNQAEREEYSRAPRDSDGGLRRVAPMLTVQNIDHVIFGALKTRFNKTEIFHTDSGPVLAATGGPGGIQREIPLDRNNAVIFELPRKENSIRRISITVFLAYDEEDRNMRRLLSENESLGIFRNIDGEKRPDFLYDYALSLREEFTSSLDTRELNSRDELNKQTWIEARRTYFEYLDDFLSGPAEMYLIQAYEERIAAETAALGSMPGSMEILRLTEIRNATIKAFSQLRAQHDELLALREKLDSALLSSFCILGRGTWPDLNDVEASALLANSILTGRAVKPGQNLYLLTGALVSVLLICFLLKSLGPASTLGAGALMTLLICAGFSLGFFLSGVWLDPLVPSGAAAAGVFVSLLWVGIAKSSYSRRFRLAYGPFVSRPCLKSIIRAGKPLPSRTISSRAVIVAIKNSDPAALYDTPASHARAVLAFHKKASDLLKEAGGTIIGLEEEIVAGCFGSPLEKEFYKGKKASSPYEGHIYAKDASAITAVNFVSEAANSSECEHYHFGIDFGNCSFSWTSLTGYFALGAPVQRAKLLSRLAGRFKTQVLLSATVNEIMPDLTVKKMNYFKNKDGTIGEAFYGLGD